MLHSTESDTEEMLLNVDYNKRRKCSPRTLLCSKKFICCCGTIMMWGATSFLTFAIGYHIKARECLKEGYIFKESIELIERSLGTIDPEYFTGFLKFQVRFKADVCYPIKGQQVLCTVESKNKLGIKAVSEPLHIILARQHHPDKTEFEKIKMNK